MSEKDVDCNLLILPTGYIDYSMSGGQIIQSAAMSEWICVHATVKSTPITVRTGRIPRLSFAVSYKGDGEGYKGMATVTVFGGVHSWGKVRCGDAFFLRCKPTIWNGQIQFGQPEIILPAYAGRVVPKYSNKTPPLPLSKIQGLSVDAASVIRGHFDNMTDEAIFALASIDLSFGLTLRDVLVDAHHPRTLLEGYAALALADKIARAHVFFEGRKQRLSLVNPASSIPIDLSVYAELLQNLPFCPSSCQLTAISEILADLQSDSPMFRILSGDVNTGKTLTFGVAAALTYLAGGRSAILTPNVLLAGQIVKSIRSYFPSIPAEAILHVGTGVDYSGFQVLNENKRYPILIGTTAIFGAAKSFWGEQAANLLVIDEQQKLSRQQRSHVALCQPFTNILEATATCIPRTTALIQCGGMDCSRLMTSPIHREVVSGVFQYEDKKNLMEHIRKVISDDEGGQVAVIYPAIKSSAGHEKQSISATSDLWKRLFPGRVAFLHGKMTNEEKQSVIDGLHSRSYDIVVATTILEIGLTLPSLKLLVVIDAGRFGLSQLHQLRGRVARTGGVGYFFTLMGEGCSDETLQRVRLLELHEDGFSLAENDMDARGFGDLSCESNSQHGVLAGAIFQT